MIRHGVRDLYEEASYLFCDVNNKRPRIINSWELMEQVMRNNLRMSICGEADQYQVWFWNVNLGQLEKIHFELLSDMVGSEYSREHTWVVKSRGDVIGEIRFRINKHARVR